MSDEYLWDRGGEPDAEVARLEKMLGSLRYQAPQRRRTNRYIWAIAAAAIIILAALVVVPLKLRGPVTSWQQDGKKLRAGQWIETGGPNMAMIESDMTGEVTIEPKSRIRLLASGPKEQFDLQRGTIHALIWAPPGRFVVETPSARTVDLGCQYTLQISDSGKGLLTVETGWVAFEWDKRESFIPAGAACLTRPGKGPGTPWFSDAPEAMKKAVERFDESADEATLQTVIQTARDRDALTLWHLLGRTSGEERAEVFDRFQDAVKLPASVTREAILAGKPEAVDGAWNAMELGSTDWWRNWERKW